MDRLFDVNLLDAAGWTDGEEWADCNPAQDLERVYKRTYSGSGEDDPEYRIDPGDNFFIGSHPETVRDWTPRTLPWVLDVNKAIKGNTLSFYFGLQVGESEIDTKLDNHSPWMQNVKGDNNNEAQQKGHKETTAKKAKSTAKKPQESEKTKKSAAPRAKSANRTVKQTKEKTSKPQQAKQRSKSVPKVASTPKKKTSPSEMKTPSRKPRKPRSEERPSKTRKA